MKKSMFKFVQLIIISIVLCFPLYSQELPKVFIAPMENGLNEFLTSAFIKEKVPVTLVITDEVADFVLKGTSIKGEGKWYDTIFGSEKDRNQGSITLLKVSDKSITWAGSAGDKPGFWDTAWSKGGQRKVASRLAKMIKKEYFNNKPKKI